MSAYQQATDKVGGLTRLAELLKVPPQVVGNWKKRGIPTDRALDVERVTNGHVTAAQIIKEYRQRQRQRAPA